MIPVFSTTFSFFFQRSHNISGLTVATSADDSGPRIPHPIGNDVQGMTIPLLDLKFEYNYSQFLEVLTVIILRFLTEASVTQCRPRSHCIDQELQCLPFRLHLLRYCTNFRIITVIFCCPSLSSFYHIHLCHALFHVMYSGRLLRKQVNELFVYRLFAHRLLRLCIVLLSRHLTVTWHSSKSISK